MPVFSFKYLDYVFPHKVFSIKDFCSKPQKSLIGCAPDGEGASPKSDREWEGNSRRVRLSIRPIWGISHVMIK